jgi:hypothetical protein
MAQEGAGVGRILPDSTAPSPVRYVTLPSHT